MKHSFVMKDGGRSRRLMELDEDKKRLTLDGKTVAMTFQEFSLLCELCRHADEPVSRETILKNAWGFINLGTTRTVDVHVRRLRRKLGQAAIETVYRFGYKICAERI